MTIYDLLSMIGGLSLFLFGMNIMGQALERRAGDGLRAILGKLTSNRALGFLTGLGVTAIIQSSSATTVMVVGFVNSGLMTLSQAINVIMGANVGTTVTAWVLSLSGIESGNFFVQMFKPSVFTPVLALIGIILQMTTKDDKKKDTGLIMLGFATLMFGMDTMSASVSGLKDVPAFQQLFIMFRNPFLGMLAGAILTAIIQSSSASVGILQALAVTGQVTYGAAIPIIMGQNIGTCITAMLSGIGANKNARRTALVHLSFNIIGTVVYLIIFAIVDAVFAPAILSDPADKFGIAVCHSVFNVLCTILLLPMAGLLEKLVCFLIPDAQKQEQTSELDERLFATPAVALQRCQNVACEMAAVAAKTLDDSIQCLETYSEDLAAAVREGEDKTDHYEDILGSYLVKLSALRITSDDSNEAAMLLKVIGDFERISDHGCNLLGAAEELRAKKLRFTDSAHRELEILIAAVQEIMSMAQNCFVKRDVELAYQVEPLEQVIDDLKETLRKRHIQRVQHGECKIETGFIWSDMLTDLERVSDHCSNIAECIIDLANHDRNTHATMRTHRNNDVQFQVAYAQFAEKYTV